MFKTQTKVLCLALALLLCAHTALSQESVTFPSEEIAFVAGPQVRAGTDQRAAWFDLNARDKGLQFGAAFPVAAPGTTDEAGTVSVSQAGRTVTGTGTLFRAAFPGAANNHYIWIKDSTGVRRQHYLTSVDSDSQVTLSAPWAYQTIAGARWSKAASEEVNPWVEGINYYDQALVQYINFYRTGDARFLSHARKIADAWYSAPFLMNNGHGGFNNTVAPRVASLNGLMLRALDGRPEMWPWIVAYVRESYGIWIGQALTWPSLYYGAREGGYMLLYAANVARVHPDAAVRAEFRQKALDAAVNYYARLQKADGTWRWGDESFWRGEGMQPFQIGLLLEGMIATHRLTNDAKVATAIVKGVEGLHAFGYNPRGWRALYYLVGGSWPSGESCATGCGAAASPFPPTDPGLIAEARQLNTTVLHAYGYAYLLSGDAKFKQWGDEVLAHTYEAADGHRALVWYNPKNYGEGYRAGGRYLSWTAKAAAPTPTPSPQPSPPPTPTPAPLPSAEPYAYETRPWPSSTAARLALLNEMGGKGYRLAQVISSTAYFEKRK